MSSLSICIVAVALITNINCQDVPSPYPSSKPWFEEKLPSRSDIVNVTIIYHTNVRYSNVEVRAGVGQKPQTLNDLQKNTQLCGTSSRYMARLGNYKLRTIICETGISADYIIIQVRENISPFLNAVLVNNTFLPTLRKAYNLTSSGGAKTKYPHLMGVYKLSDKVNNFFPVYKQDGGPGMAYVDLPGNWAIGEEYTRSLLFSRKHPISPSPPATEWQYMNLGWDGSDSTLLMVPIDPVDLGEKSLSKGWIIGLSLLGAFVFFQVCCILHAIHTCRRYKSIQRQQNINIRMKTIKDPGCFWWTLLHTKKYTSGKMLYEIRDHLELQNATVEANPDYGVEEPEYQDEIVDYNDYYGDAE